MSESNIEFEIKSKAPPEGELTTILRRFSAPVSMEQEDIYFDAASRKLFKAGVFLRVRDSKALDIKFNPDLENLEHLTCKETRFNIPVDRTGIEQLSSFLSQFGLTRAAEAETLPDFFGSVGLDEWVRIKKNRSVYKGAGVEFCVDEVEGLGRFVEIEVTDPSAIEFYTSWAASLKLTNLPVGYVELYLRRHDWHTYLQGRYILPQDRSED